MSDLDTPAVRRLPVVLFVCTANSARSIMAEAILRHHAGDRFEAHSCGMAPAGINPLSIEVLQERGIDTAGLRSKSTDDYLGKVPVRDAIILCDKAQLECPRLYPFAHRVFFWPFEDPAVAPPALRLQKFRAVRDAIEAQVLAWAKGAAA